MYNHKFIHPSQVINLFILNFICYKQHFISITIGFKHVYFSQKEKQVVNCLTCFFFIVFLCTCTRIRDNLRVIG